MLNDIHQDDVAEHRNKKLIKKILRENEGCGESLAQISNFHIYMGMAA